MYILFWKSNNETFIFIPKWGIVGAVILTLVTQILTNIVIPTMYKDTRKNTRYIIEAFLLRGIMKKESIKQVVKSLVN